MALYVFVFLYGPLRTLAPVGPPRAKCLSVADSGGTDLWPSEKMLPQAQAGAGHARDTPGNRDRSSGRLAEVRLLGTAEHRVY